MNVIKNNPLSSFFVLAYLFSWTFWIFLSLVGGISITSPLGFLLLTLGGLGPFVSAAIISGLTGALKELKTTIFKWKVDFRWYLVALFTPIMICIIAYSIYLLIGGLPTETPPIYLYPLALLYVIFLGGGLEEPGWRGFALPRLFERHNPLISSLIVGIFWTFWHLPLFFHPETSQYGLSIAWYFLNTIALSIIFTYLFIKSERSTFLAIILHGGANAALSWYPGLSDIDTVLGTISFFGPITFASWIVVAIILSFEKTLFLKKGTIK